VMLWMSLLVVVFLAWHFANIQKKEAPLNFSAFMEEVEQGKIAEAQGRGPDPIEKLGDKIAQGNKFLEALVKSNADARAALREIANNTGQPDPEKA